ncbi:MAG: hypothetical protein ABL903_18905 [Methylococcales bacterium]
MQLKIKMIFSIGKGAERKFLFTGSSGQQKSVPYQSLLKIWIDEKLA